MPPPGILGFVDHTVPVATTSSGSQCKQPSTHASTGMAVTQQNFIYKNGATSHGHHWLTPLRLQPDSEKASAMTRHTRAPKTLDVTQHYSDAARRHRTSRGLLLTGLSSEDGQGLAGPDHVRDPRPPLTVGFQAPSTSTRASPAAERGHLTVTPVASPHAHSSLLPAEESEQRGQPSSPVWSRSQ